MTLTYLFTIWQEILHFPLEGPKLPPNPEFLRFSELRSSPEEQSHFPRATEQIPPESQSWVFVDRVQGEKRGRVVMGGVMM